MKIGFIGLGIMGKPMSKNLLKAGYSLVVRDRNTESVAEVVSLGATSADSAKAVAEQSDVIITMLPSSTSLTWGELGSMVMKCCWAKAALLKARNPAPSLLI